MASENKELVLLDLWASMFCMRPKIALAEKGIADYECKEQNIGSKSPLLLEMNPVHKKVPVLIHNGKPICESLIIVEYIDEVWKDKSPLLPSDPYERSRARFWADFVDKKFFPIGFKIWTTNDASPETTKEFMETLKTLEEELGDKTFFGGDNFGFMDVAFIPYYSWFETYEKFGKFSIEPECPKLIAWAKRCLLREAVSSSLPEMNKVYNAVLEFRKPRETA